MKTIGLLGGMSWESTLTYYQIINMVTAQTLGGLHSARCLLYSVDFDEIERCQQAGDWDKSARILADAAQALKTVRFIPWRRRTDGRLPASRISGKTQ